MDIASELLFCDLKVVKKEIKSMWSIKMAIRIEVDRNDQLLFSSLASFILTFSSKPISNAIEFR